MKFTIKKIDEATGNVTVSFDVDDKDQNIAGLSIYDEGSLLQELREYGEAYARGKELEKVNVDPKVKSLIAKPQEA